MFCPFVRKLFLSPLHCIRYREMSYLSAVVPTIRTHITCIRSWKLQEIRGAHNDDIYTIVCWKYCQQQMWLPNSNISDLKRSLLSGGPSPNSAADMMTWIGHIDFKQKNVGHICNCSGCRAVPCHNYIRISLLCTVLVLVFEALTLLCEVSDSWISHSEFSWVSCTEYLEHSTHWWAHPVLWAWLSLQHHLLAQPRNEPGTGKHNIAVHDR